MGVKTNNLPVYKHLHVLRPEEKPFRPGETFHNS